MISNDNQFEKLNEQRDGSSPEQAVIVQCVREEYDWIRDEYPNFSPCLQALLEIEGKKYDMMTIQSPEGEQRNVYFDLSKLRNTFLSDIEEF
ncbi:MAG: hypothetical protein ACE15F_02400 [bacterium]